MQSLVDDLVEHAKTWGWQQDQGTNASEVNGAEKNFKEAKADLEKAIGRLESAKKRAQVDLAKAREPFRKDKNIVY